MWSGVVFWGNRGRGFSDLSTRVFRWESPAGCVQSRRLLGRSICSILLKMRHL
ncbi:unnamed protein product [Ixodes pacificus]